MEEGGRVDGVEEGGEEVEGGGEEGFEGCFEVSDEGREEV